MGVLEDAIREHLELKRQHGASEEEVQREQSEALGPVRRAGPADADEAVAGEAPPEVVAEPAAPADDSLELVEAPEPPPEEAEEVAAEEGPAGLDGPQAAPAPTDVAGELEAEPDEPSVAAQPEPAIGDRPEDFVEQSEPMAEPEPVAFDEEEPGVAPPMPAPPKAEEQRSEGGDDDVLEETPDFLEDTPEHDRLWFEQKPPRDFDFD